MRIAVLTNAFPPEQVGGAARIAEIQVELLREAGHEIQVFCPAELWTNRSFFWRLLGHVRDFFCNALLHDEIVSWRPNLLLTHNLTGCGFATPHSLQQKNVRWVHMLHDVQLFEPSGRVFDARVVTLWQRGWSYARRSVFGKPDAVISPTRWLIDQHLRRGWHWFEASIHVVPNPGPSIERIARAPHQPLHVLFVGRVAKDKGADVLVELMKNGDGSIVLEVVGDGPSLSVLRELSHVFCVGACSSEKVLRHMREADVLLVPSRLVENQPTVILEAASVGLPVIASPSGGILETLGEVGTVCAVNDLLLWSKALGDLRDPSFFQTRVEHMYALAQQHDVKKYGEKLMKILRELG